MLSKSSFFTTILLLLPAMASAQTADDDICSWSCVIMHLN